MARTAGRRRASVAALALTLLPVFAPGCAATLSRALTPNTRPAPFVCTALDLVACCTIVLAPFAILDLPVSLVVDLGSLLQALMPSVPSASWSSSGGGSGSFHWPEEHPGTAEHRECPKAAPAPQAP